jgi:cobalt-zinc-cadmium efflux system outer membrane protein
VADLDEDVAGWDYETERVEVMTEATQAFAVVLAAQERLDLADELVRIADESLAKVMQEVEEGLASPIEGTRARVARSAAVVERERIRAELMTARGELAASWGSEEERFDRVSGDLEAVRQPPRLESLIARIETNPDLARWTTEVERRSAAVELERAQRIPDVALAAGVRRLSTTTDTALVFGFEVPIPLVDRNEGGILAARYELAKAEEERRAARLRVRTRLAAADDRLQSAYRTVTSLRGEVLPEAEAVFEQILAAFDAGDYPYDDVLDAQRTLFRLRGQYLEALEAYHVAVADVERLIGEPLHATPGP